VPNGVLWVMRTGAPWRHLPDRYPPYQTCHRRFQLWARNGTLARVLHHLARELAAAGGYDFTETFIDATFAGAKKGAAPSASRAKGKAPRSWHSQTLLVYLSPLLSQDGRQLRRYCRRRKIERLFAWLQDFRRLVTRYERHVENFLAFVQLACIIILSRQFVS
jgi:transposase